MLRRLLRASALSYLRADAVVERARLAAHGAASGFLGAVLGDAEKSAISVAVYETAFATRSRRALNGWEIAWFERRLPPPPARILVGAAGQGPEVLYLCERGYTVDALEPARAAAGALAAAGADEVAVARYDALSAAVLDRAGGPAASLAERRYDAVILGWGSLSHVLDARERSRLLEACVRLAPDGPILTSFLARPATPTAPRAQAAGARAGRWLRGRLGGHEDPAPPAGALAFGAWFGFIYQFQPEEIEALATEVVRWVDWERWPDSPYPHVTLIPVR